MTFGNDTNFPQRVITTSNMLFKWNIVVFHCKHYKLLTPEIRGRSQFMVLIKVSPKHNIYMYIYIYLHLYIYIHTYIYIHIYRRIFWSTYRKLTWVVFIYVHTSYTHILTYIHICIYTFTLLPKITAITWMIKMVIAKNNNNDNSNERKWSYCLK